MRKDYRYVIFDADHTLIDFDRDEKRAFRAAFLQEDLPDLEGAVERCWRFSSDNWARLGLYDVHTEHIQQNYHILYRRHVQEIFDYAAAQLSLKDRARAEQVFRQTLSASSHFVEGALETLAFLKERYKLCVATNGLTEVQSGRLREVAALFEKIFISENIGAIKPSGAFFAHILRELNARPQEVLMVGDSVSSDVAGAAAAGIDSVWFDRSGRGEEKALPASSVRITALRELKELLG